MEVRSSDAVHRAIDVVAQSKLLQLGAMASAISNVAVLSAKPAYY